MVLEKAAWDALNLRDFWATEAVLQPTSFLPRYILADLVVNRRVLHRLLAIQP